MNEDPALSRPDDLPDSLRKIADWMDAADKLITRLFEANNVERTNQGDDVQQDLHHLASWFAAHPDVAADAWGHIQQRALTGNRKRAEP